MACPRISDKWAELKPRSKPSPTCCLNGLWNNGSVTANITSSAGQPALVGGSVTGQRIADTPKIKPKASTTTVNSQPFYQLTINAAPGMNGFQSKLMMDKIKESERANKTLGRARYSDGS